MSVTAAPGTPVVLEHAKRIEVEIAAKLDLTQRDTVALRWTAWGRSGWRGSGERWIRRRTRKNVSFFRHASEIIPWKTPWSTEEETPLQRERITRKPAA